MSVLERCPYYRESNKGSKERQGPTLSVRLIEVSIKRESTVYIGQITIERISVREGNRTIHWIEIYPVDSAIPLNNCGLMYRID